MDSLQAPLVSSIGHSATNEDPLGWDHLIDWVDSVVVVVVERDEQVGQNQNQDSKCEPVFVETWTCLRCGSKSNPRQLQ